MMSSADSMHIIFRIGSESFGLPVSAVSSIIRYEEATSVPRTQPGVLGVINIRGRVVPVIDAAQRLQRTPFVPSASSRIIVAVSRMGQVGLAVDSATEVTRIAPESILPVPEGVLTASAAHAMTGVVEHAGELVVLLELDEVIPSTSFDDAEAGSQEGESDV